MQFDRLKRREFITLLGAASAWPRTARAQQGGRTRRIGVLMPYFNKDAQAQARLTAFTDELQQLGWIDARNIQIDYRWAGGDADRGYSFAKELVRSAPDVIVVNGYPAFAELHRLTSTISIVFTQVSDPVGSGLVAGLAHPGGNVTGFSNFEPEMGGKWVGVLKEAAPNISRVAVVFGSDHAPTAAILRVAQAVAPALAVEVTAVDVRAEVEIERAIAEFANRPGGGLIVTPHPKPTANRGSIIALAARYRLPAVYPFRYFATEGELMSYGPDQIDQWRGAATYVDRILRGEKPTDLPIQAPTKFELVVNLKTARALGLSIPPAFPLRADEVIE
jgi:putative ABC transport system substrate-binding protein